MKAVDVTRILLMVVGIGGLATDQSFSKELSQVFGTHAVGIIAVLSATSAIASTILHTVANPSPSSSAPSPAPTPLSVAEVVGKPEQEYTIEYNLPPKQ
jgi:hypothetical protein